MISKTNKLLDELIKLHPKYIDLSLERLKKLLFKLGNPHLDLPKTIHIAGTNGKGSVQSFIRNILITNGYSCDAYISPHLTKFNERIILNNKEVSTKKLLQTLEFVKKINNNSPITFFEITTAAAFVLFNQSKSDFLLLETGLGGRLDATNIIPKKTCSIIMPISFDHEEFLGNTLTKITKEKLGIIKNSDFVIISKQNKEVRNVIKNKLFKFPNVYYYGTNYRIKKIFKKKFEFKYKSKIIIVNKPYLNGYHQIENASVALAFSEIISQKNYNINFNKVNNAIKNTKWPGRLEIINYKDKKIILDGSHNIDGAKKLKEFLEIKKIRPTVLFGMLKNKKIDDFLNIIKFQVKNILAIKIPDEDNSFKVNEIANKCKVLSIDCIKINNVKNATKFINNSSQKIFLITGSLYLVGKIRKKFL
ncbi:bifunctional folylpolyglutamate synthase/dihydrofolate synthase [Pelagibacteraceae bacterium]|nr:bifunctional folylpolyglutamate synthase/dihydrofolate synthase [Pelagibacteraceae bacterium]